MKDAPQEERQDGRKSITMPIAYCGKCNWTPGDGPHPCGTETITIIEPSTPAPEQGLPPLDVAWAEEVAHLRADGLDDHERTRAVLHCRERQLKQTIAQVDALEARVRTLEEQLVIRDLRKHEWQGSSEIDGWYVGMCSCGWTWQEGMAGSTEYAIINHWRDHLAALPAPPAELAKKETER